MDQSQLRPYVEKEASVRGANERGGVRYWGNGHGHVCARETRKETGERLDTMKLIIWLMIRRAQRSNLKSKVEGQVSIIYRKL